MTISVENNAQIQRFLWGMYHLFNAQMKVSESWDEAFLCGDNSERHAATALAASEFDMATSDKWLSWRLNKLKVKQKKYLFTLENKPAWNKN